MAVATSRAQTIETARARRCFLRIRRGEHITERCPPQPPVGRAHRLPRRHRPRGPGRFVPPTHEQAVEFALGRLAELEAIR